MSPRQIGLLAALSAVWGGSYLLIKYGLEDLEPAVIVWVRLVLAAVVLYAVMRLRGGGAEARAAHAELRARPWRALLLGTVAIALPFNLITFGELEVPSGLTAVLIAPASLFVAAFAPLIDPSEKVPAGSPRRDAPRAERRRAVRGRRVGALDLGVPRRARDGRRGRLLRALELRGQALQGPDLGDDVVHLDPRRRRADAAGGDRHRAVARARACAPRWRCSRSASSGRRSRS